MEFRRPNECPHCGFAYTAFNRPIPASSTFLERFRRSLREQGKYGSGPLAKVRYVQAEQTRPFQCRCGTWLRANAWSFGWVDWLAIAVLAAIHAFLAARFPWARNAYAFALPIGLWVGYRTMASPPAGRRCPRAPQPRSPRANRFAAHSPIAGARG